ncbi:hypothetical protein BpHYR1_015784 [Brachionus plicatilis]|uniref:Uncharacterized protein n=1 Tax=Brachionus plicatilis TaxID=10195 RepID=A0A3M7T3W2_BRAPC|nr:hypothetical protein BpHYR1_015784 [Brachionus plicatilis]
MKFKYLCEVLDYGLKYDTTHEINDTNLESILNRLFELSDRYVGKGLSHSIPLIFRLAEEYKGFELRFIEYPTPLFRSGPRAVWNVNNVTRQTDEKYFFSIVSFSWTQIKVLTGLVSCPWARLSDLLVRRIGTCIYTPS